MRIITWNMGCAYPGSRYRAAHADAWRQVEALNPDIALLQEVSQVPDWVDQANVISSPRNRGGGFQTVVYVQRGSVTRLGPEPDLAPALRGQAVMAVVDGLGTEPVMFASVHTLTGDPTAEQLPDFEFRSKDRALLPRHKGSWNAQVILDSVAGAAATPRFIVGGDFNLAWRFEETGNSRWAGDQFRAMRQEGWHRPHLRFHAGEQRTLFNGKDQPYQLDHFFVDQQTLQAATKCDVVEVQEQERLSDHAPLLLEVVARQVTAP